MIKIQKVSYKALKKLSVQDRLEAMKTPGVGQSLMSALTPTQLAELFPDYYRRGLPDISGFQKAIPSAMLQAKQKWYDEQIQQTVTGEREGRVTTPGLSKPESSFEKFKRKAKELITGEPSRKGAATPPPKLTQKQREAIEELKKNPMLVTDERLKFISGVDEKTLKKVGIEKFTQDGKDFFKYTPPQTTPEQAKESLRKAAGGGTMMKSVYNAFVAAGFSTQQAKALTAEVGRENDFRPDKIYGSHSEPGGGATTHGRENIGMLSFAGDRNKKFREYMTKEGAMDENGNIIPGDKALKAQARFIKQEMTGYSSGRAFLSNPEVDRDTAGQQLANYIGWDIAGRHINPGPHIQKRNDYYSKADVISGQPELDPLTKDFTAAQIEAEQKRRDVEEETSRFGTLAGATSAQKGVPSAWQKEQQEGAPTDKSSIFSQAEKIGRQTHSDFVFQQSGRGGSKCGIGARSVAGALFGHDYFGKNGLGSGHFATAASLSGGNRYFQNSGMYNEPSDPSGDLSDPEYRKSLPIGTVISAAGGNSKGEGHVQIKVGPGPNDWASDFDQSGHKTGVLLGERYHSYKVHIPNEQGQKTLADRGHAQIGVSTGETQKQTPPEVKPAEGPKAPGGTLESSSQPITGEKAAWQKEQESKPAEVKTKVEVNTTKDAPVKDASSKEQNPEKKQGEGKGGFAGEVSTTPYRLDLGKASAFYESGKRGVETVSTGRRDKGGVSYGSHQLASKTGTMSEFLNSPEGKSYKDRFGSHKPGSPEFSRIYKDIAKGDPEGFARSQHEFIARTHYEPVKVKAQKLGYDVENPKVQEALYSMSVQHRRRTDRVLNDPRTKATIGKSGEAQVSAMFDVRTAKWSKYRNRYSAEKQDILAFSPTDYGSTRMAQVTPTATSSDISTAPATPGGALPPQQQTVAGKSTARRIGEDVFGMERKATAATATVQAPKPYAAQPGQPGYEASQFVRGQMYRPDITPQSKAPESMTPATAPTPTTGSGDIAALRHEMNTRFDEIKNSNEVKAPIFQRTVSSNDPNMINSMKIATEKTFDNPTSERALGNRPHFSETGGPVAHFSSGNNI